MTAVPIAVEPSVTIRPNSSSPSAVAGERSAAQVFRIERQQSAQHQDRRSDADSEVDEQQAEQRMAQVVHGRNLGARQRAVIPGALPARRPR